MISSAIERFVFITGWCFEMRLNWKNNAFEPFSAVTRNPNASGQSSKGEGTTKGRCGDGR